MRARRVVLWGLIAVAAVVVGAVVLMSLNWPPDVDFENTSVTPADLEQCERLMHLSFPGSSRPLGICGVSWQDTVFNLKVSMSRNDVGQFLASSPFADTELDTETRHVHESAGDPGWWDPEAVHRFESGETTLKENGLEGLKLLISHDDPDHAVIYLTWYDF